MAIKNSVTDNNNYVGMETVTLIHTLAIKNNRLESMIFWFDHNTRYALQYYNYINITYYRNWLSHILGISLSAFTVYETGYLILKLTDNIHRGTGVIISAINIFQVLLGNLLNEIILTATDDFVSICRYIR